MKNDNHALQKSRTEPPVADALAVGADVEEMRAQIQARAYHLWLERGCPVGSPEVDWLRAEDEIRNVYSRKELSMAAPPLAKGAGM